MILRGSQVGGRTSASPAPPACPEPPPEPLRTPAAPSRPRPARTTSPGDPRGGSAPPGPAPHVPPGLSRQRYGRGPGGRGGPGGGREVRAGRGAVRGRMDPRSHRRRAAPRVASPRSGTRPWAGRALSQRRGDRGPFPRDGAVGGSPAGVRGRGWGQPEPVGPRASGRARFRRCRAPESPDVTQRPWAAPPGRAAAVGRVAVIASPRRGRCGHGAAVRGARRARSGAGLPGRSGAPRPAHSPASRTARGVSISSPCAELSPPLARALRSRSPSLRPEATGGILKTSWEEKVKPRAVRPARSGGCGVRCGLCCALSDEGRRGAGSAPGDGGTWAGTAAFRFLIPFGFVLGKNRNRCEREFYS